MRRLGKSRSTLGDRRPSGSDSVPWLTIDAAAIVAGPLARTRRRIPAGQRLHP